MLRSRSNWIVIEVEPSALVEVICATPGICANWRLQRLRHRRGHGLRTGAGQARGDLDGGKVDLRQRRDRQARIGDDADEQDADHQQRGRDRDAG